jgi:transposase
MTAVRSYTTVPQFAEELGVSQHSILLWISRGELAAVDVSRKRGGRPSWRISREAIERFEAARSAQPRPTPTRTRRRRDPAVTEFY